MICFVSSFINAWLEKLLIPFMKQSDDMCSFGLLSNCYCCMLNQGCLSAISNFINPKLIMQPQDFEFYVPKEKFFGEKIKQINIGSSDQSTNFDNAIIMSGFPYDEGTKRNGGRVGGALASTIFRRKLKEVDFYLQKEVQVYDSGDIQSEMELQDAHIKLYEKHKQILQSGKNVTLFSIGGSNDQSYSNVRALLQAFPEDRIGVINLDAHFDVRPLKQGKAHSGSPFRQMLQNEIFVKNGSIFIEFASKGATCSNEHFNYLKSKGATVYWLQKNIRLFEVSAQSKYLTQAGQLFQKIINEMRTKVVHIFVSFDNDSINSKFMPGVSAPSVVGGLTSAEAIEIMKIAGLDKKVNLVDFSEFNPAVESQLSSRMLVEMFYAFVASVAQR